MQVLIRVLKFCFPNSKRVFRDEEFRFCNIAVKISREGRISPDRNTFHKWQQGVRQVVINIFMIYAGS